MNVKRCQHRWIPSFFMSASIRLASQGRESGSPDESDFRDYCTTPTSLLAPQGPLDTSKHKEQLRTAYRDKLPQGSSFEIMLCRIFQFSIP
nr:hypothetical protein CFP56_71734 [Quercus suber]